jgi:hypothetical protein
MNAHLRELMAQIDDYEARKEDEMRRYRNLLMAHPHCADEGHPGCSQCYDEPDDDPRL